LDSCLVPVGPDQRRPSGVKRAQHPPALSSDLKNPMYAPLLRSYTVGQVFPVGTIRRVGVASKYPWGGRTARLVQPILPSLAFRLQIYIPSSGKIPAVQKTSEPSTRAEPLTGQTDIIFSFPQTFSRVSPARWLQISEPLVALRQ